MHYSEAIQISTRLSDEDLVREVQRLAQRTRATMAILVAHLAELEGRRLHLAAGYPSLFACCTDVLRLSEHEAYHRIEAARLARRFPIVLQKLAEGTLTLTTARLLSSQLTEENRDTLLAAAEGKSKREVQILLARMFPAPDVPQLIRKVPAPRSALSADGGAASQSSLAPAVVDVPAVESIGATAPVAASSSLVAAAGLPGDVPLIVTPAPVPARSREAIRPLAADRYEIRFTASAATREKLQLASDLLRHAIPGGDVAEIVDRALTALLADLGKRCRERGFLEFHHVHPYAEGGEATVGNIELRCRAHNSYEAEIFYGSRFAPASDREAKVSRGGATALIGAGHIQLGPDRVGPSWP